MIIVSLTYIAPISDIDPLLDAHVDWLERGYASGRFLASGRKVPRTGGVILARGTLAEVEAACSEDPFARHKVATYDFTEMAVTMSAEGLDGLLD